jgi:predicted dehydrogenase
MFRPDPRRLPVNVGLIGCGQVAQAIHLGLLTRMRGVRLTALADTDRTRLAQAGDRVARAARFTDYTRLLPRPDVDAVVICLPNALHAEVAVAALRAGKHVYLEKPLATNLAEARRVWAAWQASGRVGMIGFNYRFHRLYRAARDCVRSGRIGPVVAARSVFTTPPRSLPAWKQARHSGGGVLLDLASHEIDLLRYVLDQEVAEVSAHVRSLHTEGDTATLQLRMTDDAQAQVFVSLCAGEAAEFEVYGQAGSVRLDRYRSWTVRVSGSRAGLGTLGGLPYLLAKLRAPANEPSFGAALAQFVGAVRGDHPAGPDFLDGYRSLAVLTAAEEAARTGRTVTLAVPAAPPKFSPSPAGCQPRLWC